MSEKYKFSPADQKRVIGAAFVKLNNKQLAVRPAFACGHTLRTHLEYNFLDAMGDDRNMNALPDLLFEMREAALLEIRRINGTITPEDMAKLDPWVKTKDAGKPKKQRKQKR